MVRSLIPWLVVSPNGHAAGVELDAAAAEESTQASPLNQRRYGWSHGQADDRQPRSTWRRAARQSPANVKQTGADGNAGVIWQDELPEGISMHFAPIIRFCTAASSGTGTTRSELPAVTFGIAILKIVLTVHDSPGTILMRLKRQIMEAHKNENWIKISRLENLLLYCP